MEITPLLDAVTLSQLQETLNSVQRVVLTAHRGPDGDAMGSVLAWADYLRHIGKHVRIVLPNPCADFLSWLPGAPSILFYTEKIHNIAIIKAFQEAELICLLDYNAIHRVGELSTLILHSSAVRMMIDHHEDPEEDIAQFLISRPSASSTCEMIFRLIYQLGGMAKMSRGAATCIYCGMMTDTGGFSYASNDPEIFLIVAHLLTKGIDKDQITRKVNHQWSVDRLQFWSYLMREKLSFYYRHRASLLTITRADMRNYNYMRGDLEGLVNEPLKVRGMRVSISLREDTEKDVIRISVRSVDDFPANEMAERFFNGGGHFNAAGGELPFPLSAAVETVKEALEAYRYLL